MNRNRWIILASVLGLLAVVAFLAFRPDKLFVDDTVDEQLEDDVVAAIAAGGGEGSDRSDAADDTTTTAPPGDAADSGSGAAEAPTTTTTPLPEVLGEGSFVSQGGHTVNGSAFVVDRPEGRLLVLPELDSENGPDLQLYLSPQAGGSVDGGVKIGPLKGNIGTQSYELPDDTDLTALNNVVIWCERFATPFGTATLA